MHCELGRAGIPRRKLLHIRIADARQRNARAIRRIGRPEADGSSSLGLEENHLEREGLWLRGGIAKPQHEIRGFLRMRSIAVKCGDRVKKGYVARRPLKGHLDFDLWVVGQVRSDS